MKNKIEYIVGLVTIIGITILVGSIIWGKNYTSQKVYRSYSAEFQSVNNIKKGDIVEIRGVVVGAVTDVNLNPDKVIVSLEIEDSISLFGDASAKVVSKELMGGRKLLLYPGVSKIPLSGYIAGNRSMGLTEALSNLGGMMDKLNHFLVKTDSMMAKIDSILPEKGLDERLDRVEEEFVGLTSSLKSKVGYLTKRLDKTLTSYTNLADSLDSVMPSLTKASRNFGSSSDKIETIMSNADSLISEIRTKADILYSRDGTIGSLIKDKTVYNKIDDSLDKLDSLIYLIKNDGLKLDIDLF